ncbi:MAG: glycosyltransferase family 39 protein, partial [Bacteroidales bacterium]|nr:glycosyltransferase family 39 protein [Bacteroidales bacterium]
MMKKISNEWFLITGLALIKLLIHLLTNTNYELHRDAFLYYSLGEHLDWGYLSVPPFIAILSKISVVLFGKTVFALRFFPAIIGSLSIVIMAKMVKELNGGRWAIVVAATAFILSPSFLRSNTLFQPVSFNQFFWLLSAYLILKLINSGNPKIWLGIFVVFGIAFLTKYSITFFILSFLLALLLTKHRNFFLSKYFIIGGTIGCIIILPNLLWQYNHNWPVISHMSELQETQFVNVSMSGFFIDQLMMNLPGLFIWLSGLIVVFVLKIERKYILFAYIYLFTVLIILLFRGKSYYTLGLYPILFAIGGYAVEKYYKPYLKYALMAFVLIIATPMLPYSLPLFSHERISELSKNTAEFTNRWEDGKIHHLPQDYADMIAWKELADLVIITYKKLSDTDKRKCLIYADQYCTAGAIFFYGKSHGLPEPISFNDN